MLVFPGVVIERGDADGNAHALAHSACTAPQCGLGASTVGLDLAVVSPGKNGL